MSAGTPAIFVDWPEFWAREVHADDWLYKPILGRGRSHAIYARHGRGKSLFTLWLALKLALSGVAVLYTDYEMTEDDLRERLSDMGCGPDTDLALLRYLLLPDLGPLDTAEGAEAFLSVVLGVMQANRDRECVVILDTIGRAVAGDENSSDTFRDFYRHTGLGLKQLGLTTLRLDHSGWDEANGARGSSGKGDDVDVVWRLEAKDHGLDLVRVKSRMGWVPERVSLGKSTDPVLAFQPSAATWPLGTLETAATLDRLGVPLDASAAAAQAALKDAGEGRRKVIVLAALKYRRIEAERAGTAPGTAGNRWRGSTGTAAVSYKGTAFPGTRPGPARSRRRHRRRPRTDRGAPERRADRGVARCRTRRRGGRAMTAVVCSKCGAQAEVLVHRERRDPDPRCWDHVGQVELREPWRVEELDAEDEVPSW